MGSRFSTRKPGGRVGRTSAGAASFVVTPGLDRFPDAGPGEGLREPWALKTTDTLRPGERGPRRLVAEHGDRLVCVRYRCAPERRKRYKTVELIVAEAECDPPPGPDDLVQVRVAYEEEDLRRRVKEAGGRWRPETKTWELPLGVADELVLRDRVVR